MKRNKFILMLLLFCSIVNAKEKDEDYVLKLQEDKLTKEVILVPVDRWGNRILNKPSLKFENSKIITIDKWKNELEKNHERNK